MTSIGIDLGTTNSCVAVFQDGKVHVISNWHGENTTPSYVTYTDNGRLFGNDAKNQAIINPNNTIFDAKRLIGRKYHDTVVQNDITKWPFKVVNVKEKPVIEVQYQKETKQLHVEEISAAILWKLKEVAEEFLGREVINAVITVPAYFNDAQRQSTKDAAEIADLHVMRIINEPTAAALAYGFGIKDSKRDDELQLLVFDLGGGTFDVSILVMEEGVLEVKSTSGDTHLGSEDFTGRMVDYFAKEIKTKHGYDISHDIKAMSRLTKTCEAAKKMLSTSKEERILIESLINGKDFNSTITRTKFEELNEDLFQQTLDTVRKTLKDANMDPKDIDDIVLVGGSTRIIKVQTMLRDFFGGKALTKGINPDEAVAIGAAIQAARLDGVETIQDTLLIDVAPLSLGIETAGGMMNVIIPRNTPIPKMATKRYTTKCDNQVKVDIIVFEGERLMTKDNNELGKFTLDDIKSQPRGEPSIDVTFEIDSDGILKVSAVEKSGNKEKNIEIKNEKGRLTKEEIDRMIVEAENYSQDDKKEKARIEARLELEKLCLKMKSDLSIGKLKDSISDGSKQKLHAVCDEALGWLGLHKKSTIEEMQTKTKTVNKAYDALIPY